MGLEFKAFCFNRMQSWHNESSLSAIQHSVQFISSHPRLKFIPIQVVVSISIATNCNISKVINRIVNGLKRIKYRLRYSIVCPSEDYLFEWQLIRFTRNLWTAS